ncbi:MAG: prolipoprotein diacylglyceryl transferase, partial [bacterium]|nr:prolipoprotein diacylglyceryl transferase [bacterium]
MNCAVVEDQSPQALGVTCWFDAREDGEPYDVDLKFTGTTTETDSGEPRSFVATRTVAGILPGVGTMAYTARFADIEPGVWNVSAGAIEPGSARAAKDLVTAEGRTAFRPVVSELAPGMSMGAWPAMVGLGALAGVASLLTLVSRYGISVGATFALAAIACVVGLIGAKIYYLLQSTGRTSLLSSAGMCIQGFVIGAFATMIVGGKLWGLPWASLLDLAVPGLMLGMFLGRFGCWRGGCCAGRPSTSRLALWSTDRQLGVRRIPVQLVEGAAAGVLAVVASVLVWRSLPQPPGALFAADVAAYVIVRQLLFPLRGQAQHSRRG